MTKTFKLAGLLCTYGTTNQGNDLSIHVVLPNGRKVEICSSKEGADEFVDTVGTDFISTNLTVTDDEELTDAYTLLLAIAETASREKIASGIPESELRIFIEQALDTLDTLSTDRNWVRSGTVSRCHGILLQIVACFSSHPSFLKHFLSNEGLEAVAKFFASRKKNDTPNHSVTRLIRVTVHNTLAFLTQEGLSYEKSFALIEKTGLLGQFIRCIPVDPEGLLKLWHVC
jgi:hypothetical protein